MKKLLLVALACAATLSAAQAQTGRIAHLSHAGRIGGPAAPDDNLGLSFVTEWRRDSLVCVSKSRLEHRGEVRRYSNAAWRERTPWQRQVQVYEYGGSPALDKKEVRRIRRQYPNAVFIKPARATQLKSPASTSQPGGFRKRPFQYGYWRGLATVAALGAVGWLLGCKPKAA